jgi:rare lipoprotein A
MRITPGFLCLAAIFAFAACSTSPKIRYTNSMFYPAPAATEEGIASWYHANWLGIGEMTASGERFHQYEMTCAHKALPLGTFVRVVNLRNGRSTIARINDRGPYIQGRIVDLSKTGARELGILNAGIAPVRLEVLVPLRERRAEPAFGG